ncbi:SidA/IucD/PvdA family monooxygenase [Nesterenkonia sp. CL21]|uniref:lysine N(6)-hydroxylase/L-ornithine N(5)-oxygenase family protein n=1 Tax=Nesterenkonia sp. CL21 TaxID=3064894 RepID=UPI002878A3FB|nr:SidA/IucD/PvdA family monooxygenase [Nesterenkonia sp. CL21]MDS2174326.1 SidA/IucD/PvdA family monooxygenase [Nesterenkonia sp. CL21]
MTSTPTREEAGGGAVHDVVGIGIGPFNLGLACLAHSLEDVDAVFLDSRDGFAWHHGMMLTDATIQVPFLADLVTMADPTSEFSFLNWLKQTGRLYPFYIREDFHPLRSEYDAYCRWAADRLPSLRWGRQVESVEHDAATDTFVVTAVTADGVEVRRGRHVVMGIGTAPHVPAALREDVDASPAATHSADYLHRREEILAAGSATVVGSGQSAAEIFLDLLESHREHDLRLDWITRSPRFFSMEDTRLTLELTSPEYTDHFHRLPEGVRDQLTREQRGLYKGISTATIDRIHDALYRLSAHRPLEVGMLTDTEVTGAVWDPADGSHRLQLVHRQLGEQAEHQTGHLILATGYTPRDPSFLEPVEHLIGRDAAGRLAVGRDYRIDTLGGRIFVQNAEEHTHGLTAPDLGMGAWRSASILATITGEEHYPLERRIAFQQFGLPTTAEVPR